MQLSEWQTRQRQFGYKGHNIVYMDEGKGQALLCVHGFPTAGWDWSKLWPWLTEQFRVIAPDMVGFGFSAKPRHYAYSLFDQADLHEALLLQLNVNKLHILAHDYGNTVVQEMLARELEGRYAKSGLTIESVTLLNGGLFPEAIRPIKLQTLMAGPLGPLVGQLMSRRRFGRSFSSIFGQNTQPSKPALDEFWALIVHNRGRAVMPNIILYMKARIQNRERWVGALEKTAIPMRLIVGLQDPISGSTIADRYMELIPKPDVVQLTDIGHYPQLEAPQAVWDAFWAFVQHHRRA